jgi:hypothetical protein
MVKERNEMSTITQERSDQAFLLSMLETQTVEPVRKEPVALPQAEARAFYICKAQPA